ncbi:MAG: motility associated factor glycosyltransferase family protein [Paraglaciecola sp.]|nr:motility associated factor glycosyltransferase family protein [Paraglaciecola sp.]
MLKNIRLHIDKDEEKQAQLDKKLASHIVTTHNSNINAFQRNIPSLLPYVQTTDLANYSIFINKYGEHNIVDYGMGRTFYGFHPEEEVLGQLSRIEQHCPEVVFQTQLSPKSTSPKVSDSFTALNLDSFESVENFESLESVKLRNLQQPMPYEIECLVVLGCGLGIHLSHLLKQHKIKNLLIYEPELQYFQCSVMTTSWQEIFTLAKKHETAIFLQLEKDGRDLIQDVNELIEHCSISSFHIYKHYNHEVFDSLHKDLSERNWNEIENSGFKIKSKESYLDYLPKWTPNVDLATHSLLSAPNDRLANNLKAFKKFFPEIYKEYKNYTPQKWLPVSNSQGEVNLVKIDSLHSWYGESPKQDCTLNFENFNEQPNKDGLVLGYRGTKLAHYIHYQFVEETEELLKQAEEEVGALPNKVPSIIMFGLGVGYQLEKLLDEHTVEKLFICEPNPDFFYASLFAINWQHIFETVETSESRIYLNIGDDGTNLFRDLLNQFYAIGPYILNSTYFYQSYYNASLNSAISQLREQLQVVISMGEYFDHAYYGIAHTKEGMKRKIPILAANPARKLSYDEKEVPVFIVGNGPSLDHSIETIKEWQGQAIVVSCGTTLQALHRHGITPDFHAEIEQNRSTFDWAVLIGDLEYLKNITLISCNGIHPDTCDLYKDVLIAFKEGESSTVSALNVLGRKNFTTLLNAFPTVSNFAIDLFSTIGFTSIYLIGVDLGFVDVKHHHSKSSGYYQADGTETYDFTKSANTSLIVPGNFRPRVNTKHEFKVSRQVIEQVTSVKSKGQDFYNCSDGAKIQGTLPIRPDELLIVVTEQQKAQAIDKLKTSIFSIEHLGDFLERFEKMYSQKLLIKEFDAIEILLAKEITSKEDVENIINTQKEVLFASYKNGKSLLFYYLYGTVNFANALLTKLSSTSSETGSVLPSNIEALNKWLLTFRDIKGLLLNNHNIQNYDCSGFKVHIREQLFFPEKTKSSSILLISSSEGFKKSAAWTLAEYFPKIKNIRITSEIGQVESTTAFDYVIYFEYAKEKSVTGLKNTLLMANFNDVATFQHNGIGIFSIPKIVNEKILNNLSSNIFWAIRACLSMHTPAFVIPKLISSDSSIFNEDTAYIVPLDYSAYDFQHFLCVFYNKNIELVSSTTGTRGQMILGDIKMKHTLLNIKTQKELDELDEKHRDVISGSNRAEIDECIA